MASRIKISGFKELDRKLGRLDESIRRKEIVSILKQLAEPIRKAYSDKLPVGSKKHTRYTKGGGKTSYDPGNLRKAVVAKEVPQRFSEDYPSVQILPDKNEGADGYYRFMVVKKGFKGSGRGSRKGANVVVTQARNAALAQTGGQTTREAEQKTAAYIQKQINRLSN